MPLILVAEPEGRHAQPIRTALTGAGWRVQVVEDRAAAFEAVAAERPQLILVSADLAEADELIYAFCRRMGGPGVVALVDPGHQGDEPPADEILRRPFEADALRAVVRRHLAVAGLDEQATAPPDTEEQLTSADIFGDLVAEVESELGAAPESSTPAERPATVPAKAPGDLLGRQLEQTLSGLLEEGKTERTATPRRRRTGEPDVEALLSETLSGLELGRRKSRAKPAPAKDRPPAGSPAADGPRRAGPGTPRETRSDEIDWSEIEALAGPRPPETPAAREQQVEEKESEAAPEAAPSAAPTAPSKEPDPAVAGEPVDSRRFGQYTLLERIAVGGMAEVWKARMSGVEGFQKTVAIKRILPHLTDNSEFVGMFIDEAKLAAQLNHPNIIHIYDLGKIGEDYYIAMEYVEGKNLRSVLNEAREKGNALPQGLALLVAARLASALDYAHRKKDFDGRELALVHRDISPQNVLMSYEGDIKLCDFGIAKAVSKASQTQMGALKGKLQYMSPEQAWGKPVDARSDIFSLGSLLFEMLTGRRLFAGDSELSVLEAVRQCRVQAPRAVDPEIPEEVDSIVLKALALEPDERYQSAGRLQQDLEAILYASRPAPNQVDLAEYLTALDRAAPVPATAAPEAPQPAEPEAAAPPPTEPAAEEPASVEEAAAALPETAPDPLGEGTALEPAAIEPAPDPLGEGPAIEPMAPDGEFVEIEEGGNRGRRILVAAILAILLLGLAYLLLQRFRSTPQSAPDEPAPTVSLGPPTTEPEPAPESDSNLGSAPIPASPPLPVAPEPAAPPAANLAEMVDEELARREEELRRRLQAEEESLARRLEESRAALAVDAGERQETPPESATRRAPAELAPAAAEPSALPAAVEDEAAPALDEQSSFPGDLEPVPPETVEEIRGEALADLTADPVAPPPAPEPAAAPAEPPPPAEPGPGARPVRPGDLVGPGPGVTAPVLVTIGKAEYPPVARRMRISGDVVLAVLVDEGGRVEEIRVIRGIKQEVGLDEAAIEAARQARFEPATKDGVRVKMWTTLRIPFKL